MNLEVFGSIRKHLEAFGAYGIKESFGRHLEVFASICMHLGAFGCI